MNFKGKGGDYEKPALGSFAAVCYKIIDLGTQDGTYNGKPKRQHKMFVSWELDQKMKDGRPFSTSKKYTVSLGENSHLRKDLEAWRGKKFTKEEMDTFSEKKILGKACLLTLGLSEDGEYVNIVNVTALPSAMAAPAQVNPTTFLSLQKEEFDQKVFDGLSDKMKASIMSSPEWAELKGLPPEAHHGEEAPSESTDEVPF